MERYKYPRTYHFPFSPGRGSDDKVLDDFERYFANKEVVITEKMDGENTTIYRDMCHARSIDSLHHLYHSWLLQYAQSFQYLLGQNERVCGEYLYARHSIEYTNLPTYFLVFSIWNRANCLSWDETEKRCKELGLQTVPVLYKGCYNQEKVETAIQTVSNGGGEGIVMRLASGFTYDNFSTSIVKYVRANHVQSDKHWSQQAIIKNRIQER
ncbi:MAG: RNA ligase family protein [Lachnospiraceae bacterium]|nr:RNA ligase family protein [Lachnospiraceae bacterium]